MLGIEIGADSNKGGARSKQFKVKQGYAYMYTVYAHVHVQRTKSKDICIHVNEQCACTKNKA